MTDDSDADPHVPRWNPKQFVIGYECMGSSRTPDYSLARLGLPPLFQGREHVRLDAALRYMKANRLATLPTLRAPVPPAKKKRRAPDASRDE